MPQSLGVLRMKQKLKEYGKSYTAITIKNYKMGNNTVICVVFYIFAVLKVYSKILFCNKLVTSLLTVLLLRAVECVNKKQHQI